MIYNCKRMHFSIVGLHKMYLKSENCVDTIVHFISWLLIMKLERLYTFEKTDEL